MRAVAALLLTGLGLCAWAATRTAAEDAEPVWQSDFAAARRLARQHNRPILAVLH